MTVVSDMKGTAPLDPTTLHSPLTNTQRTVIVTFLKANGYSDKDITTYIGINGVSMTLTKYLTSGAFGKPFDPLLIEGYTAVANGGGFAKGPVNTTINNPITGVTDALGRLVSIAGALTKPQFWIRAGEFTVGLVFVGVAVAAALRNSPSAPHPTIPKVI